MAGMTPEAGRLSDFLAGRDDAPAFSAEGRTVSRVELRAASEAAAAGLTALGFSRGDVLAIWLPNGAAWLQLLFAAERIGVLVVPISTRYKAAEVRHLLQVSRARMIVAATRFLDVEYAAVARGLLAEVPTLERVLELDDIAGFMSFAVDGTVAPPVEGDASLCCFSTSGTTGFPKLAAHGHASIARHAVHVAKALDIRPGDATLCVLPLFGVFGFMTALGTLAGGGRCEFMAVFDAEGAARTIERERITHIVGADAMFDAMLKVRDVDFSSCRRGVQADFVGLTLPVTQRGDELGIKFSNTYGSSECYALMSFHDWQADAAQRAKSGGVSIDPDIGVRVADPESGRICAEGEPGEIQIRGPNLLSGYLNNPEATAKAMTADGWFRSGDLGFMQGAGFVYLARMGDSLRLRGYLVNPAEIENCLMEHASVGGAQVVGVNRPGEGDMAVAYVIAGTGVPDEARLIAHCRERMASYKVPRRVILIDEFPAINGPNGNKIQKRVLRDWAAAAV
jgi:acyl-CoA synthetase (AMP-forming)/AMP-acid ligase II